MIAKLKLRCIKLVCIRNKAPSTITSLPHNNNEDINKNRHKKIILEQPGTYLKKFTTVNNKNITETAVTKGHGLIGTICMICLCTRDGKTDKKKLFFKQVFQ